MTQPEHIATILPRVFPSVCGACMSDELKPCPKCSGEAVAQMRQGHRRAAFPWVAHCAHLSAKCPNIVQGRSKQEAIVSWNRRLP